jgi:L-lysine 6-transaminase
LHEPVRTRQVQADEQVSEAQIRRAIEQRGTDIAAIILETIQGEGGDNHFRPEWFKTIRTICDEKDVLLIFDEVQCGMGATGRNWACQHFDVLPDLLAFGKKAQVCGVMAGPRLDEVADNCFRLPGRINSTWGGNLTDMVRSRFCLEVIERDKLVENASRIGKQIIEGIHALAADEPIISAVRGRGLLIAFDLPDKDQREKFYRGLYDRGLLAIRSGERSVRFRPALDIDSEVATLALKIMREQCRSMRSGTAPGRSPIPRQPRVASAKK